MATESTAQAKTLPKGDEYIVNGRGLRNHLRTFLPTNEIRGIIFFFHGYGGHCSSACKHQFGQENAKAGLAAVLLDQMGHGYSEGERAFIEDWRHWLQDSLLTIETVCGTKPLEPGKGKLNLTPQQTQRLTQVPFFVSGESLGSAIALVVGFALVDSAGHPLRDRFRGAALIAPAIAGNPPPAPIVWLLRHTVAKWVPTRCVPDALESVRKPELVWLRQEDIDAVAADSWGAPGGIGWGKNMRFGMATNMLDLTLEVQRRLEDAKFPIVVLHDPKDGIVQFEGTRMLMRRAPDIAPVGGERAREVKEMTGLLHDLLTNAPDQVCELFVDWLTYQLSL